MTPRLSASPLDSVLATKRELTRTAHVNLALDLSKEVCP